MHFLADTFGIFMKKWKDDRGERREGDQPRSKKKYTEAKEKRERRTKGGERDGEKEYIFILS